MDEWDFIENMILGEDDQELEELERSIDINAPMVRTFYGLDKSKGERLLRAIKFLPVMVGMMLICPFICPFWLLYEEYLLPVWWKVSDWWELIQWEHEHMPVEQHIPMSPKQKRELIVQGIICIVLLIIIIYLYYLMEKLEK